MDDVLAIVILVGVLAAAVVALGWLFVRSERER